MLKRPRRLPLRQHAQNVVEYGLIVAVIAIASIAGFNALSGAERGYFGGMGPVLAPPVPTFAPFAGSVVVTNVTSTAASMAYTVGTVAGGIGEHETNVVVARRVTLRLTGLLLLPLWVVSPPPGV